MIAGIVMILAKGRAIFESIKYEIAPGSDAVMTHGSELCRREDTDRLC